MSTFGFQQRSLVQQGYDASPERLRELSWALRFTPAVCMVAALAGLWTRQPLVHFALAALGILPFFSPARHPVDVFYNHVVRPLWRGVSLPPNPLPRRIACLMGGAMNLGIGISFVAGNLVAAYSFGAILVVLQMIVIGSHFCVASWLYEGVLRLIGRWIPPVDVAKARRLVEAGARLIDVRNPDEFARAHLPGAQNIPLGGLVPAMKGRDSECLVLYCQSGLRCQQAAQVLRRLGFRHVHPLGAMSRWFTG